MSETDEEPTMVEVTVTCGTDGCTNQGIPITITTPEGGAIMCGPCGASLNETAAPA